MQITILAVGSRGDVQPYVALGLGFKHAGYQVRVAAPANFESFVRGAGLDYAPMGGDFRALADSDTMRRTLEKSNLLRYMRDFSSAIRNEFECFARDAWSACQGTDAVIFSTLGVSGYSIAQKLHVPSLWAPLQPQSRTREFPSAVLSARQLGGALNWASHLAEEQMTWQPFRQFVNAWRRDTLGLNPYPFNGPFDYLDRIRFPILYGYSPSVLPKPRDWGDWLHVTGYWFLDRLSDWQPPAALLDFLQAGPAPVYIGFGSMSNRKPAEVTALVVNALALAKQRGILMMGWGGLSDAELPDTIFKLDAVPHDWLFPRVAAVVHHGGAGTTGAALRAGIPSVITPFSFDQPFWAQRVHELGVGPKQIPRPQLTAERLADAITQAVTDCEMSVRAAALGERIRAEDGIARAIEEFEQYVRDYPDGRESSD